MAWKVVTVGVAGGVLLGVGHHALGRSGIHAALNEPGAPRRRGTPGPSRGWQPCRSRFPHGQAGSRQTRAVVGDVGQQVDGLGHVLLEQAAVRLAHAHGQAVIEVAHRLTAMLIVLVRLDGDAGQRGVAGDVVGLAQHAVTGGEAALEELPQLNLAAGGGQGVEVHVVNVDIALAVCLGVAAGR